MKIIISIPMAHGSWIGSTDRNMQETAALGKNSKQVSINLRINLVTGYMNLTKGGTKFILSIVK